MTRPKNELQIARAQSMYREGYTFREIAKMMHVTDSTVHMWVDPEYRAKRIAQIRACPQVKPRKAYLRKPADDPPVETPKPRPINWQPEIVDLRRRGFSKQAIAAQLRVPYRQVEEALR
jgi:DNA-binding NarL/FixJ family response regulator